MNELIWVVQINDQTSGPLKSITTQVDSFIRAVQSGVNDLGKVFDVFNTYMDQAIARTIEFTDRLRSAFRVPTPDFSSFERAGMGGPGAAPGAAPQPEPTAPPRPEPEPMGEPIIDDAFINEVAQFEEASNRANESIRRRSGVLGKATRLLGKFFGIEKKVTTETKKSDTANQRAAGSLRNLSAAALAASGQLGRMAGQVQENALGLEQLGLSWSKVFSVMRKLSIGYIIMSLAKAGLNAALRIKDMNAQLYMTIQQSRAVAGVIDQTRQQAVALGLSVDELKGIVQTGVQVAFLNRTVRDGEKVLRDYTKATLETAQATGLSAENIGQLYQRIIGVGAIADVNKLRNIGAGIKFIADQSMLSSQEVLDFTASLEDMFRLSADGMGHTQTEMTGDLQAIAGALSTYIKPQTIAEMFTGLQQEIARGVVGPVSRAWSFATGEAMDAIQDRFKRGDVVGLMEDFTQSMVNRTGPQIMSFARTMGNAIGITERELLRLQNFEPGAIRKMVEAQRKIIAEGKLQADAAAARQNRLTRAWNQAQDALAGLWEEQGMRVVDILNKHLIPAIEWLIVKIQDLRKWWNGLSEDTQKSYVTWGTVGLALFAFSEKIGLVIGATSKLIGWIVGSKGLRSAFKFLSMDLTTLTAKMKGLRAATLLSANLGFGAFLGVMGAVLAGVSIAIAKWREWTKQIEKNRLETIKASGFAEEFAAANANVIGEYDKMRDKIRELQKTKQELIRTGQEEAWVGEAQLRRMQQDAENTLKGLAMQIKDMTKRELFLVNMGLNEKQVQKVMSDIGGRTIEVAAVETEGRVRKAAQESESAFMRFSERYLDAMDKINQKVGISEAEVEVSPVIRPQIEMGTTAAEPPGAPPRPTAVPQRPPSLPGQDVEGKPIVTVEPDQNTDKMVKLLERMVSQNEKQIDLSRRVLGDLKRGASAQSARSSNRRNDPMNEAMRYNNGDVR